MSSLPEPPTITVLLIDDQLIIGRAVARMVAAEPDIEFHFCQDPLDAVRMALAVQPTVILQDLVMPQIDGLNLTRYLRATQATRQVPLIVLSSKEDAAIKAEAFAAGANDYLVKLPEKVELLARVRYHSQGYINGLERDRVHRALVQSQRQLELRNQFIREAFGRFVSDDIAETILASPEGMQIGGERREVTVIMTDLRGFTATCGQYPPETVVAMLNTYLEIMTDEILALGGTIVEFIGDAIVVLFGAPVAKEDDPDRAVACALRMQLAMTQANQANREHGFPELSMGIGVNTGEVIVGNIGSKKRTKYDAIGHNMNLAARIESYSLGGQILVSRATLDACAAQLRVDDQLEVMPKGIREPITIYEIGGIGPPFDIVLPRKAKVEWFTLDAPLPIQFSILEGKHGGQERYPGKILQLAERMAVLEAQRGCRELTNLKIALHDAAGNLVSNDLYAKVTEIDSEIPPVFRVALTTVPPEADDFLADVLLMKQQAL